MAAVPVRARYRRRRGRKAETSGLCFSIYHIVGRRAFDRKTMSKEYVYADARWTARFLRFRRYVPMSSDLPYALVSWSYVSRKTTFSSPEPHASSVVR